MKTAMKKVLSLTLVLVLLLSVFPMTALATENGEDSQIMLPIQDENDAPAAFSGEEEAAGAPAAPAEEEAAVPAAPAEEEAATPAAPAEEEAAVPAAPAEEEAATPAAPAEEEAATPAAPAEEDTAVAAAPGDKGPGHGDKGDKGERPTPPPTEEDKKEETLPAPTALTVKFYVDNALKETVSHNAAATVQELINACCTVDDTMELNYSGARVENTPYELSSTVNLGEEVHIYLYTKTAPIETTPAVCDKCKVDPCICCECGGTEVAHKRNCPKDPANDSNKGKVDLILNYNYKGERNTTMKVDRDSKVIDLIAGIPAPTREGYQFMYWTMDQEGLDGINEERVSDKGTMIYAQWSKNLAVNGRYTVYVNLNYDHKMGDSLTNIAKGTKMDDVLDYVTTPSRNGYKFAGWYWDSRCHDDVDWDDKVYHDCEIFAKWERRYTNHEITLKIYLNGNTKSVAKVVDMYDFSKDDKISISEVKEAVKWYYTAKDNDGLDFDGLFEADAWSDYVHSRRHNHGEKAIYVNQDDSTIIYVMVNNAKVRTSESSGTADTTNPKTGDMIMAPAIVLGASVSALAVLFYLNKKRVIK